MFIHLPTDGRLHCSFLLALVNSAASNIYVHLFSVLWGLYLEVEVLNYMVIVHSYCKHRLHPFPFPQVMFKGSNFSALLATFVIFNSLYYNHFRVCEGVIASRF